METNFSILKNKKSPPPLTYGVVVKELLPKCIGKNYYRSFSVSIVTFISVVLLLHSEFTYYYYPSYKFRSGFILYIS